MFKPVRLLLILWLVLTVVTWSDDHQQLELKTLEGNWEGRGEFIVPITGMLMSVQGQARFDYDSMTGHLRTALTGKKFLFAYSDSGYLIKDSISDSISWEVWDNFGKHAKYYGEVSGNKIVGNRLKKNNRYRVMIELVTTDSIDFRLTVLEPDSNQFDKAVFNLWRVKE